jgi:hypothetical protein
MRRLVLESFPDYSTWTSFWASVPVLRNRYANGNLAAFLDAVDGLFTRKPIPQDSSLRKTVSPDNREFAIYLRRGLLPSHIGNLVISEKTNRVGFVPDNREPDKYDSFGGEDIDDSGSISVVMLSMKPVMPK